MNLLHYLVQVNLYLVLFYGFYRLLLFGETFYALNRAYLVGSAVLSFGIPFWYSDYIQSFFITQKVNEVFYTVLSPVVFGIRASAENPFTWYDLLKIFYVSCTVFLAIKLIFNLLQLKKLLKNTPAHAKHGVGFSFFNFVFVDKDLQKCEVVLEHEFVHIRQLHSADVMLFELIAVLCWFNPVVYFYKKSIKNIHEFIADDIASRLEPTKADYAMLLFSQQFGLNPHQLTNSFFNHSTLKRRIEMLQKPRSRKIALLKYGFTAPLFALMLVIASASIAKHDSVKKIDVYVELARKTPISELPIMPLKVNMLKDTNIVELNKPTELSEIVVVGFRPNNNEIDEEVFTTVEENPQFEGGVKAMYQFIGQNLKYPKAAQTANIQGTVYVKFIVRKDGSISNITVLKGIGNGCDEEVVRIVGMLPKWKPGKQNGKFVNVYFTMPVKFIIEGDENGKLPEKLTINIYGKTQTWTNKEDIKREIDKIWITLKGESKNIDMNISGDEKEVTYTIYDKASSTRPSTLPISKAQKGETKINVRVDGQVNIYPLGQSKVIGIDNSLLVIDGIVVGQDVIKNINPENIESISVLKDAAAIALYGEKGKNGVIIMTTKKTKEEPKFTITGKQLYILKVGKNREIIDAKTANEYPSDRIMQVNVVKLADIKARKTGLNEFEEKVLKDGYDGWVDIWVKEQ
jgi:TonB family protein